MVSKIVFTNHLFNIWLKTRFDLNKRQWLIYHKTKPNQIKSKHFHLSVKAGLAKLIK